MFNKLFFCEEPREGYLVIIYVINSVIYFLTFFSVKIPERVINIWLCGFLENNKCLHLGTPAIVKLFLLQTDPHQRREKWCDPHKKKFGDPWSWSWRTRSPSEEERLTGVFLMELFSSKEEDLRTSCAGFGFKKYLPWSKQWHISSLTLKCFA